MIRAVVVRLVLCLGLLIVVVAGLGAFAFRDFRPQAMTVGQRVFFFGDPDRVGNWMGMNAHEDAHRAQYREHGLLGFLRDYVFDPEQRLRWEIEAHHADLCYRTLTHPDPPEVRWEKEARRLARYVSTGPDLTLDGIRLQTQRELSPASCGELLARIGLRELPRAEFPADAVLRGLLSPALRADLKDRVSLHTLAGASALPTDSTVDSAAAQRAWEVIGWKALPAALESGFWPFSRPEPPDETDAIALQLDSLQAESFELLARSPALVWLDPELGPEPSYSDHLGGIVARWRTRIQRALAAGDSREAEQASRALISLGLRIHGTTLQNAGREHSAQMVRDGIESLKRVYALRGDAASERMLSTRPEGNLEIFRAASARHFLTALPPVLERQDVPLSVRWGLLSTGYALVRCGAPNKTGVADPQAWLREQAPRLGLSERAVVPRIQQWPRDGWHCGGIADRRARGWRRTPERPPIHVAWR